MIGATIAVVVLLIGLGHSLTIIFLGTPAQYYASPNHWDLLVTSVAVFLVFLLLIPVKVSADWRSHGAYVVFFVSLFAEMFGFPLTVYFLSALLPVRMPFVETSFMWYVYFLGWRKVYDSKDELATTGVYKYVRHPQYLGIILLTGGWLIHWPTILGILIYPILVVMYWRLSKREDRYLTKKFGSRCGLCSENINAHSIA